MIKIDEILAGKLRALNCGFTLNNNTLTIEPTYSIKSGKKANRKDCERIKKMVESFYPEAVCLIHNDKLLGARVYCDINNL